jgi:predicted DCC family thiol-disulfide oxidoreductase YuxK
MKWAPLDVPDIAHDVILFDGDCVLCSRGAYFVHRYDKAMRFRFAAIQSPFGRQLAQRFGINADAPETFAVVVRRRAHFRSDATLAILGALPAWGWASALQIFPRPLRDWLYDQIARNRYKWFGRREQCWAGDRKFRTRILETP